MLTSYPAAWLLEEKIKQKRSHVCWQLMAVEATNSCFSIIAIWKPGRRGGNKSNSQPGPERVAQRPELSPTLWAFYSSKSASVAVSGFQTRCSCNSLDQHRLLICAFFTFLSLHCYLAPNSTSRPRSGCLIATRSSSSELFYYPASPAILP